EVHRQQLHEEPKDTPFLSPTEDNVEEQALLTASAESCPTDKFQTPQAASKSSDRGEGHGQGPQLYNRKTAANPRKVNYEHVKVSELYPGSLETVAEQQTTDGKPSAPRQAPTGTQGAPDPAPIRQTQQPQKQQDSATNSTEQQQKQLVNNKPEDEKRSDLDQPLTEKDILPALQKDGLMSTTATVCRKLKAKRINDSIFTDETFYSLEST
uniref:Ermin n=1 Tax=Macrostomum lignano TaxID=282301 RepID=A0A1I8JB60_9PLAT